MHLVIFKLNIFAMHQTSNNESLEILSKQFIQLEKLAIKWKLISIFEY